MCIQFTFYAQGLIGVGQALHHLIYTDIFFHAKDPDGDPNYVIGGVGVAYREGQFDDPEDYELFTGEH